MSVRPIDIQISIQRSNDYAKEANLQNQKPNINQLTNAREFQYHIEHTQRQVVSTSHTFHKRINKDSKERRQPWQDNPGRKDSREKTKDEKLEVEINEINERSKGIKIDIKI